MYLITIKIPECGGRVQTIDESGYLSYSRGELISFSCISKEEKIMKSILVSAFALLEDGNYQGFVDSISPLQLHSDQVQQSLYHALLQSANGDPDSMNDWLFRLPPDYPNDLGWLAKVTYQSEDRFVWMVGRVDPETKHIRSFIENNWHKTLVNPLLDCPKKPPYLLYLNTTLQSQWQQQLLPSKEEKVGDFSIFQVDYNGENVRDDIDQLMAMNNDFLISQVFHTFDMMKQICDAEALDCFDKQVLSNASFLSKLHTELHNYGHFMGSFPYTKPDKDCDEYEAVEEFKACCMAIEAMRTMCDDTDLVSAFALLVVCTRIFGYGLRAYLIEDKTSQLVREISVAVFFFETLKHAGVLTLDSRLSLDIPKISDAISNKVQEIDTVERIAKKKELKTLLTMQSSSTLNHIQIGNCLLNYHMFMVYTCKHHNPSNCWGVFFLTNVCFYSMLVTSTVCFCCIC
ncbi:hypothetical protein HC864_05770 [Candidatus Gracilibacteria bacterium]|nr:hypothetical protein [Candidatus Gracilibacteria bacterium]